MIVNPAEIRTFCTELYTRAAEVAKTKRSGNIRVGDILVAVEQLKSEKGTQYAFGAYEVYSFIYYMDHENNETGLLKRLADLYKKASVGLSEKDKGKEKPLAKLGTVLSKITDTTEQLDRSTRTSILLAQLHFSGTGNLLKRIGVVLMEFFRSIGRIGGLPQEQKIAINNKIAQSEQFLTAQFLPGKLTVLLEDKRPSERSAEIKKGLQKFLKDELEIDTLPKNLKTKIEAELNGFIGEITALLEYEEQKGAATKLAQVSQEEDKAKEENFVAVVRTQLTEDLPKVENTIVRITQDTQRKLQESYPTLTFGGNKQHPTIDMKNYFRCQLKKYEEGDYGMMWRQSGDIFNIFQHDYLARSDMERIMYQLPRRRYF